MSDTTIQTKLLILGSGCAGHTAAIYSARADLEPLVLEGEEAGGQLSLTSMVENYPGFPEGINGFDLIDSMKKQAIKFGARYLFEAATDVDLTSRPFKVATHLQKSIEAQSLIIATGARARLLGIPGEDPFGKGGVSSCATCDGAFFRNKKVVVVGGGDTAMEDALFLTRFATEIDIIHRRDQLRASKIMQNRALDHDKINVVWNSQVAEILREQIEGKDPQVKGVRIVTEPQGSERVIACDGVFLAIGHIPNTEFLKGQLAANQDGYLIPSKSEQDCATSDIYTNIPGVYAAGDVVDWQFQQAVTAAGMGCKAAMAAEIFLAEQE